MKLGEANFFPKYAKKWNFSNGKLNFFDDELRPTADRGMYVQLRQHTQLVLSLFRRTYVQSLSLHFLKEKECVFASFREIISICSEKVKKFEVKKVFSILRIYGSRSTELVHLFSQRNYIQQNDYW